MINQLFIKLWVPWRINISLCETIQKDLELYNCVLYEMIASRESLDKKKKNYGDTKKLKGSCSWRFNILGCNWTVLITRLRIGTMQLLIMRPPTYFKLLVFFFYDPSLSLSDFWESYLVPLYWFLCLNWCSELELDHEGYKKDMLLRHFIHSFTYYILYNRY